MSAESPEVWQVLTLVDGDGVDPSSLYTMGSEHPNLAYAVESANYNDTPSIVLMVSEGVTTEAYTLAQWRSHKDSKAVWARPVTLAKVCEENALADARLLGGQV